MINVLADRYIDQLSDYLHPEVNCIPFHPETGPDKKNLSQADALLVRTVTRVDESLTAHAPRLAFVGTASAGSDHVDEDLLQKLGIRFESAPGCNARAVAEYVATAIVLWSEHRQKPFRSLSVGIVGAGKAGSEVGALLDHAGFKTLAYDPPRQQRDSGFHSASLPDILSCDVITLHLPLTRTGRNATAGWLDENKIRTSQARLFINCARGSIANEQALLENKSVRGSDFILDVWNNEPVFDDEVAHSAFIGTPHIAGYSLQGKLKATHMVTRALHHHFNLPDPGIDQAPVVEAVTGLRNSSSLTEILNRIHPVQQYYGQFKLLLGLPGDEKMIRFRRLRNDISLRNEFKHMRIQESLLRSNPLLRTLGLKSLSD